MTYKQAIKIALVCIIDQIQNEKVSSDTKEKLVDALTILSNTLLYTLEDI